MSERGVRIRRASVIFALLLVLLPLWVLLVLFVLPWEASRPEIWMNRDPEGSA